MENRDENTGLNLLKRSRRGLLRLPFSRLGLVVLLLFVQVLFLFAIFRWLGDFMPHVLGLNTVFVVVMVLYLLNGDMDSSVKITWLIIVLLLPVFGALLLLYVESDLGHRILKKRLLDLTDKTREAIPQSTETAERLRTASPGAAALGRYVARSGCYPVFEGTDVRYFPSGEAKFQELLNQLEQAEKFIFLEYFIVEEGLMWGRILEILAQKAAQGVDVRVMYDGTCEFFRLPSDYPAKLKKLGIQCKVFSPISPFVSTHYNYRDHRKIVVIDGHTAFTGGVNLSDEYINRTHPFGHWKDTAVMLRGEAVRSFTLMFLQMWAVDMRNPEITGYLQMPAPAPEGASGFVLPFSDCPLDQDKVGKQVYIDILNRAERYVHIMTPYLILDEELEAAIRFAAERGVEVAVILPGIPDKRTAYALAKTHYKSLLRSGVQIYEYTPGFVHAKVFVSDDREAVVGTVNLDYRSLYHHFECAVYMYGTDCVADIEADFQATKAQCYKVTKATRISLPQKLLGAFLKAIAPLL